jgi:hypothetical protein
MTNASTRPQGLFANGSAQNNNFGKGFESFRNRMQEMFAPLFGGNGSLATATTPPATTPPAPGTTPPAEENPDPFGLDPASQNFMPVWMRNGPPSNGMARSAYNNMAPMYGARPSWASQAMPQQRMKPDGTPNFPDLSAPVPAASQGALAQFMKQGQ